MILNRRQAYLAILAIIILICLLYQSVWIFSDTTNAEIRAVTTSKSLRKANWLKVTYHVGYDTYYGSFLQDGFDINNRNFKIRYLLFAPALSRSDTFTGNWGPLVMVFIVFSLITSIVFIRKDIVSEQAIFVFRKQKPFISIQNNAIEDYDNHNLDNDTPNNSQQALKLKLQEIDKTPPTTEILTSVYKFNSNAIGIMVIYIFYFFWAIPSIFVGHLGYPAIFVFGTILIFVPLYVQNTRNPTFKMKIPDEGSLVFSSLGLKFKNSSFALKNIESAVVYLESFQGFKYRDRVTTGKTKTISDGDNNKISIRYKGVVTDFTFIIDNISDYWALKSLMSYWSINGVNVYLLKVFEDDFIIQEESEFHSDLL